MFDQLSYLILQIAKQIQSVSYKIGLYIINGGASYGYEKNEKATNPFSDFFSIKSFDQ